jgi:Protein of unknown function (DUF1761)
MEFNWYVSFIASIIPIMVGFIWYHPRVFGKAWLKSIKLTEEDLKGRKMLLVFGLCYLFSLMLSFALMPMVIHQMHMYSVFANDLTMKDPNSATSLYVKNFFDLYGTNFRTFKHGAFHGALSSLFFALPIIGIIALFEKKSFKYVAIHTGYWLVTLALMGGVICNWL